MPSSPSTGPSGTGCDTLCSSTKERASSTSPGSHRLRRIRVYKTKNTICKTVRKKKQ
jgi:hypothetical protein